MSGADFLFSGTLGDAYIALCKLDSFMRDTRRSLRRLCRHAGSDQAIGQVASLFSNVEYLPDFISFETIEDMRSYAFSHTGRYINIFADGNGRANEPDDPPGMLFNAFPKLDLRSPDLDPQMKYVGIQLHSGSRTENRRLLDIPWVVATCRLLTHARLQVFILGTGDGHRENAAEELSSLPSTAINLVGRQSVRDWLSLIAHLDYFITAEGLPAFFALSQKVTTVVAFDEKLALLRMHPGWRQYAICIRPTVLRHSNGGSTWVPLPAEQAASMALARLDPENA